MADLDSLKEAVISGDANTAKAVTEAAVAEGIDVQVIVSDYLIPAMDEVGRRFEANEYFVPELLIGARAMKTSMAVLKPLLADSGVKPVAKVAIGTVKGDLHDIGKNLVASMLEGGGFEIVDLGVDVSPEQFIQSVQESGVAIICMSALLTTTMGSMKDTIQALNAAGLRDKVQVMIGGAPITQQYANEIGADGYSDNASAAVSCARKLAKVA
ncbi:MAG: corrinoid protein [Planctomycetota bacterium]|jgi:5-methyltetrahydrofolate--homocysteine methyltransferase|nr:corrinoid protein [Planctomycetota bacterium]